MAMDVQKLTEYVLNDEELMSNLENANSAQEVSALLAGKGININAETIDAFMTQLLSNGELNEEDLENVAGGFKLRYLNPFYWVGRLLAYAVTKDMC